MSKFFRLLFRRGDRKKKLNGNRSSQDVPDHKLICVEDQWMQTTRFLRYLKWFDKCFKLSPRLLDTCEDRSRIEDLIEALARRSNHHDSKHTLQRLWEVGDGKQRNRRNLGLAFLLLLKYESDDGCWALIERVKERVHRCESAQKQAYTLVIQQSAHAFEVRHHEQDERETWWDDFIPSFDEVQVDLLQAEMADRLRAGGDCLLSPAENSIASSQLDENIKLTCSEALLSIQFMVGDYMDTHKENAFKSSLHEPARFYFDLCGNHHHRDHVNVHGINGWLCLIRGWFGCQIPMIPMPDDYDTFKGCADVWAGLSEEAWNAFCDPSNFGKDFEGMKQLNRMMLKDRRHGGYSDGYRFIGRNANDMENAARQKSKKYLQYANKFAFFFKKEFLVKRMFEVLNTEGKPEYVGFRKSCNKLYPVFKEEFSFSQDSLLEFLYDEDMMYLDIDKAAFFLWWCGVCKRSSIDMKQIPQNPKPSAVMNKNSVLENNSTEPDGTEGGENDNTCPICFEEKEDIQQIPHWESKGDISGHKMCGDCAKEYKKNECPFCHEVTLKENITACIEDFVQQVKSKSSAGDPNELAAVLETWQFFEMEYGDNPKVIYRVATLVLRDPIFNHLLTSGVSSRAPWMRDAAGIIFRLYSLCMEGNLPVTPAERTLLMQCYQTILQLVKAPDIQDQGHFYGAVYSQAMVPYICALQSGQDTKQLETIVKAVGNLIVSQYHQNKRNHPQLKSAIPERIVLEYVPIVMANVWGGEHKDPVWKAFYKRRANI